MFRRRKRPVVWLPPAPTNRLTADGSIAVPTQCAIGTTSLQVFGGIGVGAATSIPVVGDYNEEVISGSLGFSLADKQVGYSLKRIVGKIFCACVQQSPEAPPDTSQPTTVVVTAGLIIRHVDTLGAPRELDVFPTSYENAQDPYIWRRNWMLTNYLAVDVAATKIYNFPTMNADYGSVQDGPHVDTKTARRVGAEERLFLDLEATAVDGTEQGGTATFVKFWWDLRPLASITMNSGNRRNASR